MEKEFPIKELAQAHYFVEWVDLDSDAYQKDSSLLFIQRVLVSQFIPASYDNVLWYIIHI